MKTQTPRISGRTQDGYLANVVAHTMAGREAVEVATKQAMASVLQQHGEISMEARIEVIDLAGETTYTIVVLFSHHTFPALRTKTMNAIAQAVAAL